MQHLEGSGTPVLYIGRMFLKFNAWVQKYTEGEVGSRDH